MEFFKAIILGTIQGLTEFLPISSSGHLILFQNVLGLDTPELIFDVSVHLGTLVAVIIFFAKEISRLTKKFFILLYNIKDFKKNLKDPDIRMLILITVGSVPTAVLGFLFSLVSGKLFSSTTLVGFMLILTGIILWITKNIGSKKADIDGFTFKKSFLIGVAQGFAVIPGISRAGFTISTALFLGIKQKLAVRYSFLLSIPAICGAQILSLNNFVSETPPSGKVIAAGIVTACITGYFALMFLMYIIKKEHLYYFAPYCWLLGAVTLFVSL